jgi:DNA-binding PadR family transcriptional regulator
MICMGKKTTDEMPHLTRTEAIILDVLLSNGAQEMYGLEIVKASGGRISRGSVYVLTSRMEDKGLVSSREEPGPPEAGGLPRVIFTPTGMGLRVYAAWATARSVWDSGLSALPGSAA